MRKRMLLVTVGALVVALGVGSYAIAQSGPENVDAGLEGFLEVPAISTTGGGTFEARIDDDAEEIEFVLRYTVENPAFMAHIHLGQRSVNGSISVWLCGAQATAGPPACPPGTAAEAVVTGTITPADVVGPDGQGIEPGAFDELVRAIRAGRTYANVHTDRFPGGEIRGQINDDNQRDD